MRWRPWQTCMVQITNSRCLFPALRLSQWASSRRSFSNLSSGGHISPAWKSGSMRIRCGGALALTLLQWGACIGAVLHDACCVVMAFWGVWGAHHDENASTFCTLHLILQWKWVLSQMVTPLSTSTWPCHCTPKRPKSGHLGGLEWSCRLVQYLL